MHGCSVQPALLEIKSVKSNLFLVDIERSS